MMTERRKCGIGMQHLFGEKKLKRNLTAIPKGICLGFRLTALTRTDYGLGRALHCFAGDARSPTASQSTLLLKDNPSCR